MLCLYSSFSHTSHTDIFSNFHTMWNERIWHVFEWSSWLCKTWPLTSELCTVVSGESEAGNTKKICRKRGSNEEHFYFVLTETAGKWRCKERSDRTEKKRKWEERSENCLLSPRCFIALDTHIQTHIKYTHLCTNLKVCAQVYTYTHTHTHNDPLKSAQISWIWLTFFPL